MDSDRVEVFVRQSTDILVLALQICRIIFAIDTVARGQATCSLPVRTIGSHNGDGSAEHGVDDDSDGVAEAHRRSIRGFDEDAVDHIRNFGLLRPIDSESTALGLADESRLGCVGDLDTGIVAPYLDAGAHEGRQGQV